MGTQWVTRKPLLGEVVDWDAWSMPRPVGAWWLNEGGGTIANDSSGNAIHGTLINMDPATDWVTRPYAGGMALDFDVTDDYVSMGNKLNAWTDITVACRVLFKQTAADYSLLSKWALTGSNYLKGTYLFQFDNVSARSGNTDCINLVLPNGGTDSNDGPWIEAGPDVVVFGSWYTIVGTCKAGVGGSIYIDGVDRTTYTLRLNVDYRGNTDAHSLTLGGDSGGAKPMNGVISWAIKWDDCLSRGQVANLQGSVPLWVPQRYWYAPAAAVVGHHYRNVRIRNFRLPENTVA